MENLVDKKNRLVNELKEVLNELQVEKVDLLCDMSLREAVNSHPSNDLLGSLTIFK